jgi:signal transduction histidine kinase
MVSSQEPHPRYFNLRWGPVVSPDQEQLGQIFTLRDITRETEVDRMKSEFIATVSHELRTPMTSIKGALGLVLGGATGPVAEEQRELLTIAQTNVDRLIRLVNDILDLSRIESGRLELRKVPAGINEVVLTAVRELESVRQQRGLHLTTDLAEPLPLAEIDPDRIGQVLVNLLGNAYKFTDPGGQVTVRTRQVAGEIRVQVADNGPGIPRAQLESIFERFHRAPSAASRRAGGSGLGLAIARAIVEEHGGRIWAESDVGKGAVFTFALPIRTGK